MINHSQISRLFSTMEILEDRVLFDGVPDATFLLPANSDTPLPTQNQTLELADISAPRELVLIDSGVENSDTILASILESKSETAFEIRYLDGNVDGIEQITKLLGDSGANYDAVHVISHGNPGEVYLGSTTLSDENVSDYVDEISSWSNSLSDNADLLFYGCDLAGTAEGQAVVQRLGALTGADVAASDDLTGATSHGGDWDLEYTFGSIETAFIQAANYMGTLSVAGAQLNIVSDGTPTWDTNNNPGNDMNGSNGIIRSHDTIAMEVFYNTDSGGATDLNFTSVLPEGLVWDNLPASAAIDARSMIFDSVTGLEGGDRRGMLAYLPDVSGTFTSSVTFEARALGGEHGTGFDGVFFNVDSSEMATPLVTDDYDFVLSSAANMDIRLLSPSFRGIHTDATGTVQGAVYSYGIGIVGDHPTRTGTDGVKGAAPIEDNFTFDIDLTGVSPNAQVFTWGSTLGINSQYGDDGLTRNYERITLPANGSEATAWSRSSRPAGQTDEYPSTIWSEEHSTPDSGDWTVTGSSGGVFSAQVSGADTSGVHFPEFGGGNTVLPASDKWFTSSVVHVWIPIDDITPGADGISGTSDDGVLSITPRITNFDPDDAYGVTSNFGAGTEDTSNNDYTHTVYSFSLGGPTKYNSTTGHSTSGRWVETGSYWGAGDAETSLGHQYDARVTSGANRGILGLSGITFGDKFDNTSTKLAPNSLPGKSGDGWSRVYSGGGPFNGTHLTYGTDYIIEFATGGVDGDPAGWTDWNSMGDATLADDQTSTVWTQDPTDAALGGNADPDTGVRDSITKWRIKVLRDLEPGETLYSLVTMETTGTSTLDAANNPNGDIIANFVASTGDLYNGHANPWFASEYDPATNGWYTEGTSSDFYRGDRLYFVEANVDVDKTVVDFGAGNSFLAGSAATIQLDATVTIPGPDSGAPAEEVYVTDMLPGGLTVVGGTALPPSGTTYTAGDGTTQSVQAVEYWDGTSWSDQWSYGASGIRWYFGDVPLNTVLPQMTFNVLVPFDAENGESWTNTAVISSLSDTSPEELRNSSAGLVAVQVAAMSAGKFVVTPLVAEDSTIIYELGIANVSDDKDVPWFDLVDILPYDGDFTGSSINGVYNYIDVNGLAPGLEVYVTTVSATTLDSQDGTVDGYADPGTSTDTWFTAEGTGDWAFTLDDVQNGVAGAPTMGQITAVRVVSDKAINPFLGPGNSTSFFLELTPDGNVGIPSDHYTNQFTARTDPAQLPLPVTSAAVTAVVIAPDIEIEKEVALDESHTNIDPSNDAHWGETVSFDDTDKAVFRLKVANTGTADFLGATVTDNLPTGATFVASSASASTGDFSGFPATWTFDLGAGESAWLVYQIDVNDSGNYVNSVDVEATDQFGESVSDTDEAAANFVTEISAAKQQTSATRSTSDPSLFEVAYEVEIMNTSIFDLANLTLNEDLFGAFGAGFEGMHTAPVIVSRSLSTGATVPTINGLFDGNADGTGDGEVLNGDGFLRPTDSITITYTVLVDPLTLADPGNTTNQVEAGGETGGPGGTAVTDLSDDGSDPASDNPSARGDDGMGGTDDPTPLVLPAIDLTKEIVGSPVPAASGVDGNFDVTYEFTISNSGTTDLDNVLMTEDFLANLGGAFVGVTQAPTVISGTASDLPDLNSLYDGGLTDANIFTNAPEDTTFMFSGSSSSTTGRVSYAGDNRIVIDPNQTYQLSVNVVATDGAGGAPDPSSRHYVGIASYDIDGNVISPYHNYRFGGATDTILAAPLNPGDTTITLNDATGWNNGGPNHSRTLAWYGYTDSTGHTYDDYTYTRNVLTNAWDAGAISGNVITLNTPWAGPALDAGDAVRNATSGGSYQYTLASYQFFDETGTTLNADFGGGYNETETYNATLFRPGTHSVSALVLADYTNTGTELTVSDFQFQAPNESLMEAGESFTIQVTVEIDPDSSAANYDATTGDGNNSLENQASITAEDPWNDASVSDTSDDPTDATEAEFGGDSDPDDPTSLIIPNVSLTKTIVGAPVVASSGTVGNVDATYEFIITNNGNDNLAMLSLVEEFSSQFGNAFVGVVPQGGAPAVVAASSATDSVEINSNFDGDSDTELFDNTSGFTNLLEIGQTITLRIVVELDPDATGAIYTDGQLLNSAVVAGTGTESGIRVDDESDDTNETNDVDPDEDNSPDDPTALLLPQIALAKSIVGDPVEMANGNFTVQYQFVVENIGSTYLANLQVVEDFASEFGAGAFVQAIAAPVISVGPTDPTSVVAIRNVSYNGSTDTNMLDGVSGLLAPNDRFTIGITVEIDPNHASAIAPFENTATTTGEAAEADGTLITDGSGNAISVTDDSDSGTNPESNNSGEPGDTGGTDDPTPLYIADLDITKATVGAPAKLSNGNFLLSYSVVVENTGAVDLADLSLLEDVQSQFGAGFVGVSNLAIASGPGASSSITLDTTGWMGTTADADLVDQSASNLLAVGDSFILEFNVEVDARSLPTSTTPTVYSDEAAFAAATGATLREDFTDIVGNTSVSLPFTSTNGVQFTGSVVSSLGTGTETRQDPNSFAANAPDDGVFAIRQSGGGSATLRVTVPNPGDAIGIGFADVFDPAGGNPAGQWTYFKATASDGTVLFEHDERTDGDLPANFYRFMGIQGSGSQTYTHIDLEYETNGNDNWVIDHIYDLGQSDNRIENQIIGSANAVDENGDPITDSKGDPVTVKDLSDSGSNPDDPNAGEPGDTGGQDDPTPLLLPSIGLAKSAGDAVANGDNWDVTFTFAVENLGNVDLNNLSLIDDIATEFGNGFVAASGLAVQNFSGSGTAPGANADWESNTAADLLDGTGQLDVGDSFEVIFTVTIDPDGIDSVSQALDNQGVITGDGLDDFGNPLDDGSGGTLQATDVSDDGTDASSENGEDDMDGTFGNDPTPIFIADISVSKQIVDSPTKLANDNFSVTYQLVIENIGTVDLNNLSLADDIATQYGNAFVSAGNLRLISVTSTASSITVDSANWNGDGASEMINQAVSTNLVVGDSYIVQFDVEVDPDATGTSGPLDNQATTTGDAVDSNGDPITDSSGTLLVATDNSDSGTDPSTTNTGEDGDTGGSDDPTPLLIPDLGVAKQANTVTVATDGMGNDLTGSFDVQYLVVIENTGTIELTNLQLLDDLTRLSQFGDAYDASLLSGPTDRSGLVTGPAFVSNTMANQTDLPVLNSDFLGGGVETGLFDGMSGALQVGEQIVVSFTVRIDTTELTDGDANDANGVAPGNQVTGTADSAEGAVTDDSDNGLNPNTDNNSGGTDDPTPFEVPQIRIWKSHSDATSNGDGTSTITVTLRIENSGTVDLSQLTLTEDLGAQFGDAFISASIPTLDASGAPTSNLPATLLNSAWNTNTALDMFDAAETGESLNAGEEFIVSFDVIVDPDEIDYESDYLENQATVSGVGQNFDGTSVTVDDQSGVDTGSGVDSDEPTSAIVPEVGIAKSAGDAVANGENWDVTFTLVIENTGSVNLDMLKLTDDIATEFGDAYVGVTSLAVQNFSGSGTTPTANAAWTSDTTLNMLVGGALDPADRFEVFFTVTIDPDGVDSVSQALDNQATIEGRGVDQMGDPLLDVDGNELFNSDDSDSGVTPQGSNTGENGDTGSTDDPTPVIIADIGLAKEVVGTPTLLGNGNFEITYQLVVENIGTVDLANLSLVDDLATQFGAGVLQGVSSLTMVTSPSAPSSNVTLDPSNWDGTAATDMIDQTVTTNLLAIGDSFVIQFKTEVDAAAATGVLDNQATTGGTAVDSDGNVYTDSAGDDVTTSDDSDSGAVAGDSNPGEPGDTGGTDDPTPLYIASVGLAKAAGNAVANGENWDVTFSLVFENTGTVDLTNLTLTDDIAAQFGNAFVGINGLAVQNFVGTGTAPTANADWMTDTTQSMISGGVADINDTFEVVFTVTIDPDGIDSVSQGLENQATTTGEGLDENGDSLLDDNGDPLTATDVSDNGTNATDENSEDNTDGVYGNDPTPVIIADIGIAKSVAGAPTLMSNGNFEVIYQLVIENTGTVDLASLSLIENLNDHFGAGLISAGGLAVTAPPSGATSFVAVDGNWDGDSNIEMIDNTTTTLLEVGDSFTLKFSVEIDSALIGTSPVTNSVTAEGDAVDSDGDPILDSSGIQVTANDDSDSGTDASTSNAGEPGDSSGFDDPTPLYIPSIGLAKTAGDAVASGNAWEVPFTLVVKNNGTVALNNLTLVDDIASQFGNAFISASGLVIQNFSGTGTAPNLNADWASDPSESMIAGGLLNVGDSFEVTFNIRINPDAIDSVSQSLENQATVQGDALDENGDPLLSDSGEQVTATDVSDDGTDPDGENDSGGWQVDGVYGNDPTPIQIADLAIAKTVLSDPEILFNGNFIATFRLVIENTGTVDLASLSLLEDIATQFGSAYVDGSGLTIVTSPSDPSSVIAINANWNGGSVPEMLDQSVATLLAVGDSFVVEFEVEIDRNEVSGTLLNQASVDGEAVDRDGNPINDSTGAQLLADDVSDNGTDTDGENGEDDNDGIYANDFTPVEIPAIDPSGYFYDSTTGEILTGGAVTITGPTPDSVDLVDAGGDGDYQFFGTEPGTYTIAVTAPPGYVLDIETLQNGSFDPTGMGNPVVLGADELSNTGFLDSSTPTTYYLQFDLEDGDPMVFQNNLPFLKEGTSGQPPRLPPIVPVNTPRISDLLNGFNGGPGPIYSGIPIASNGNPLTLDSNLPVGGGYAPVDPQQILNNELCEPCEPCSADPCAEVQEVIVEDCGCEAVSSNGNDLSKEYEAETKLYDSDGMIVDSSSELSEEEVSVDNSDRNDEVAGAKINPPMPKGHSFLKKMQNWLSNTTGSST